MSRDITKRPGGITTATAQPTKPLSRVQAFLAREKAAGEVAPKLIFALDATGSRQPTWDQACELQASMFTAAGNHIRARLVYYRGNEFQAPGEWFNSVTLATKMRGITCRAGMTQIAAVLRHALDAVEPKLKGVVFIGDAMEGDEADELYELAGMLGTKKIPVFMFQEGDSESVGRIFAEIARLSGGAHCRFDAGSADQLKELLWAIGSYAASTASGNAAKALADAKTALLKIGPPR
jgi:hypothetical protein